MVPQLNASPRILTGRPLVRSARGQREMSVERTENELRPICYPFHERVDSYN